MKNKLVFVDAESDGLYGVFLTVALIATDLNGNELERAYYGIERENMVVNNVWVKENVLPRLGDYVSCVDETELLTKVWDFWLKYQEEAYAVCDVGYPVEMRLFKECVMLNEEENMWKAPFPMVDLSSILLAKGYDPLIDKKTILKDFKNDREYCALYDVETAVEVWKKMMCEGEKVVKDYLTANSIHVFAYPFISDDDKLKEKINTNGWKEKEFDFSKYDKETKREIYMFDKYVSAEAKDIWKNKQECTVYEFTDTKDLRYIIRRKNGIEYKLLIDSFELHIYSNNVGILYINALNTDKNITLNDIKIINNQGRCISLPYLPTDEKGNGDIECPEQLGIVFETGDTVKECLKDYRTKAHSVLKNDEKLDKSVNFLNQIINLDYAIPDGMDENPKIKVRTIEDYRMFVMCLISDQALSEEMKGLEQENSDLEEKWYSILHIDSASASCRHEGMRRELLKKRTYPRWIGYGTVYGVTQYSFMAITGQNEDSKNMVIRPFYKEYKYVMSLVLAQKIGLMEFSKKAENLAGKLKEKNGKDGFIKSKLCAELVKLQEEYIVWKNKMLIPEISNQEQGIELYQLMQEQVLVNKKKAKLDEQLKEMYEIVNVSNSSRDNKLNIMIAALALLVSAISFLITCLQ